MIQRSSIHQAAQRAGRIRDNQTCQACGSQDNVAGHHIIDYQYSGAANADNIVTLCHSCHVKVHAGRLDLLKF